MVLVLAFDERNYAEAELPITVFNLDCLAPVVYVADNHTSWELLSAVPTIERSKGFLQQAFATVECNVSSPIT